MALPPEPIGDLVGKIAIAFVGTVISASAVLTDQRPRPIGAAPLRPLQEVELQVEKSLFGDLQIGERLTAKKPPSNYVLIAGHQGVFALDRDRTIVGRLGPETWTAEEIIGAKEG